MATRGPFPGLGMPDPTPGDAAKIQETMSALGKAGGMLGTATERLVGAIDVANDWTGDAADEFSAHADDLPEGLTKGGEGILKVSKALANWVPVMLRNQQITDHLEAAAVVHRRRFENSDGEERKRAKEDLDRVRDKAIRLAERHRNDADAAAAAMDGAADGAFNVDEDSLGDKVVDGVSTVSGELAKWCDILAVSTVWFPPASATFAATARGANAVNFVAGLAQLGLDTKGKRAMVELMAGMAPGGANTKKLGKIIGGARPGNLAKTKAELRELMSKNAKDKLDVNVGKHRTYDDLVRSDARDAAKDAGKNWDELSEGKRREYLDDVRAGHREAAASKAMGLPADVDSTAKTVSGDTSNQDQGTQNTKHATTVFDDPYKAPATIWGAEHADDRNDRASAHGDDVNRELKENAKRGGR